MTKSVLVVEDDFDTQHPLAEILRLRGYFVFTASAVEEALRTARARRPDLIITDIMLPGKSGLHLILSVRSDQSIKATPIMVISGCTPSTLSEAEAAGADCCLEKPIRFDRFWAIVEQLLGHHRDGAGTGLGIMANDPGRAAASQINDLIERLRKCSTSEEKEQLLGLLKQHILGATQKSGHA